jgi:hypothetical protein
MMQVEEKMSRTSLILLAWVMIVAACTTVPSAPQVNVSQVQTAAVATYQAGLPADTPVVQPTLLPTVGKVSTSVPPTPTLSPTPRPTPTIVIPITSSSGIQYFIGDHAIYSSQMPADWLILQPDQHIAVSWTFLNNGSTTWDSGYTVKWIGGYQPWGVTEVPLMGIVAPGDTGSAAIDVFAPESKGNYITYWGLFNPDGKKLFQVYFAFVVK